MPTHGTDMNDMTLIRVFLHLGQGLLSADAKCQHVNLQHLAPLARILQGKITGKTQARIIDQHMHALSVLTHRIKKPIDLTCDTKIDPTYQKSIGHAGALPKTLDNRKAPGTNRHPQASLQQIQCNGPANTAGCLRNHGHPPTSAIQGSNILIIYDVTLFGVLLKFQGTLSQPSGPIVRATHKKIAA